MAAIDPVILQLRADVDNYVSDIRQSTAAVEQSLGRQEVAVVRHGQTFVRSNAAAQQSMRNLGFQIGDIGSQLSAGTSPFLVLAQQGPQVANALEGTAGVAGRLAAFFSGPWGAALLAAGSVLAIFASKAFEGEKATDGLTGAINTQKMSAGELAIAIEKLRQTQEKSNQTTYQAEEAAYAEARALRQQALDKLKLAQANIEVARTARLAQTADGAGGTGAQAGLGALQGIFEAQSESLAAAVANAEKAIRATDVPRVQRQVAAATDAAAAATLRYDKAVSSLNASFQAGKITREQYSASLERATRARDAEVEAAQQSARTAKEQERAAQKAIKDQAREAERAQRELEASLKSVVTAFDPAVAAAQKFRDTMKEINALEAAGAISAGNAAIYRLGAAQQQAEAVAKAAAINLGAAPDGFDPEKIIAGARARQEAEYDANRAIAEDEARLREDNVRNLASLYENLLTGGTKNIWSTFKQIGIRVIAETLAKFSLSGGSGGSGGFLGSLVKGFSAAFGGGTAPTGRASGGYVAPGQTVRVNEQRGGVELLRMGSQGGTVIPLGQVNQSAYRGAASGGVATVRLELSGDIDARIQSVSAGVAVEVVRGAAPTIIDASARETAARLSRPRI